MLTATIKLLVEIPTATDPNQPPHKLTLTNDDGSYSKTLTFPDDAQPGDTDGMSVLTFEDVTDGHVYSLQIDDGDGPYTLFDSTQYHEIVDKFGQGGSPPASGAPASQPPSGAGGSNASGTT